MSVKLRIRASISYLLFRTAPTGSAKGLAYSTMIPEQPIY